MSIMNEYEEMRQNLGEKNFRLLEQFLEENEQYLLSDVYYSMSVYREFEEWKKHL